MNITNTENVEYKMTTYSLGVFPYIGVGANHCLVEASRHGRMSLSSFSKNIQFREL